MMDYGAEGLEQTLQLLDEHGIGHAGGGPSFREAHALALIHKNGRSIAMLGYTCVFLPYGFAATEDQPGLAVIRVSTAYQASQNIPYQPGSPAVTVTIPDSANVRRVEADIQRARSAADLVVVQGPHSTSRTNDF
jgi:poly-gamma-glutamate synthesis protein (capsule biosynthesis protein)